MYILSDIITKYIQNIGTRVEFIIKDILTKKYDDYDDIDTNHITTVSDYNDDNQL